MTFSATVTQINPGTLFISTDEGSCYLELEEIRHISEVSSPRFYDSKSSIAIKLVNDQVVYIYTKLDEVAKTLRESLENIWKSWLLHQDCFENSSSAPVTKDTQDGRLSVQWGASQLYVDPAKLTAIKESHHSLVLYFSDPAMAEMVLTSSNPEYLRSLRKTIELHLSKKRQ